MRESPTSSRRMILSIILGIILLIASIYLSRIPTDFRRFATLGYVGVFFATMLGSATLFFPVPNIATVFAAGILFNPYGVAIAGGLGSTFGETVGYLVGLSSHSFPLDLKSEFGIIKWIQRHSFITIFALALIPNPLFD